MRMMGVMVMLAVVIVAGVWGCDVDEDCSLNGECVAGRCRCDAAWDGERCGELAVLPVPDGAGYHHTEGGRWVSSWGGSVHQWEGDRRYHMWASEFTNHCGIGSWQCNSQVVHASSDTPFGPFRREGVVLPPFAHEPSVTRGPDGEFVMYYTGGSPGSRKGECVCTDGTTPPGCGCGRDWSHGMPTLMIWAATPYGPWSPPVVIPSREPKEDSNMDVVIAKNGSVVGLWRQGNWVNNMSRPGAVPVVDNVNMTNIYLVTASNWKDPSTYVEHCDPSIPGGCPPLFRELFPANVGKGWPEDPNVWVDHRGHYHAVVHSFTCSPGNKWGVCGGHLFSRDGLHWHYSGPVSWGAYNDTVQFANGTVARASMRERPHMVLVDGTPVALSTSFGDGVADRCYTLVQPLRR